MKYIKKIDPRGAFQEIYKCENLNDKWKQISICSINPGQTRGSHFHKETLEKYIVIEGKMFVETFHVERNNSYSKIELSNENDFLDNEIDLMPMVHHTVYSEQGCKFLVLSSKVFDFNSTDTYTVTEKSL
ncbi:MAG: WxcM-like domain-containing protein [Candidatus Parcubacteria bacterium]|nr:WxcM-like domain-containing protein [Candidatus Parcubacteria bacterium]